LTLNSNAQNTFNNISRGEASAPLPMAVAPMMMTDVFDVNSNENYKNKAQRIQNAFKTEINKA